MQVINLVKSAMKAKSPIVGIPIPGRRPICIRRRLLVEGLKGLHITEAAIQMPLDDKQEPYLQLFATGPGVKGKCRRVYAHMDIRDGLKQNVQWADRQRSKRYTLKLSPREKRIFALKAKLSEDELLNTVIE